MEPAPSEVLQELSAGESERDDSVFAPSEVEAWMLAPGELNLREGSRPYLVIVLF